MNWVKAPGSVDTSIVPPCCLTTMSWLSERPSPVPSPAGLVVKNGLNIFAFTSSGMPVPLSRMAISTLCPEIARRGGDRRLIGAVSRGLLALGRRVEPVGNQVQEHAGHFLCIDLGGAGVRVERFGDRHVEAGLLGPRAVIGEIERLLDHRVDVGRRCARPSPRANAGACS